MKPEVKTSGKLLPRVYARTGAEKVNLWKKNGGVFDHAKETPGGIKNTLMYQIYIFIFFITLIQSTSELYPWKMVTTCLPRVSFLGGAPW